MDYWETVNQPLCCNNFQASIMLIKPLQQDYFMFPLQETPIARSSLDKAYLILHCVCSNLHFFTGLRFCTFLRFFQEPIQKTESLLCSVTDKHLIKL